MKYSPYALILTLVLSGCSGPAGYDEIGELEQPILADDQFGVRVDNLGFCGPGVSGTNCLYPPGFGDGSPSYTDDVPKEWRVCLDLSTFDGSPIDPNSQKVKATNALSNVISHLSGNNAWIHFENCITGSPNIRITATNLSTSYTAADIRAFFTASCSVTTLLTESPPIAGSAHSYCESWQMNMEADDIDFFISAANEFEVYEHAIGATLGAAVLGAGLHLASNSFWSYSAVSPVGKHGFNTVEYCRAHARYDNAGGANYTILTKTDNTCD